MQPIMACDIKSIYHREDCLGHNTVANMTNMLRAAYKVGWSG